MPNRLLMPIQVRDLGDEGAPYEVEAIASTGDVARDGDVIDPNGWRLEQWQRSGAPILWGHDYSRLPVGRATRAWVEDGSLRMRIKFGSHAFAQEVATAVREGTVSALSVGWRPLASAPREEGGTLYTESELLETSFVSVPADPGAVVTQRQMTLEEAAVKAAIRTYAEERRFIRAAADALRTVVRGG